MKPGMLKLTELRFDEAIYPRQNVDDHHIKQMMHAMEGGIQLPPIVVDRKSKRIVDGVHRYHAALRSELKAISGVLKDYKTESDLFHEAVMLNSGMGLRLGTDDTLKVLEISDRLHLKEIDVAAMLHTSVSHLRSIKGRFATYEEAIKGVKELRRVALKGSVRHLSGEKLTKDQVNAMGAAPGQSYLLSVRQLLDAIKHNLLPPQQHHPVLWQGLETLSIELERLLEKKAA